jgi:hypothetical protein
MIGSNDNGNDHGDDGGNDDNGNDSSSSSSSSSLSTDDDYLLETEEEVTSELEMNIPTDSE